MSNIAELLALGKSGDDIAIEQLLLQYKGLVKSIVRKYFLIGSDMDDLMQEGMMGLYKAILSFSYDGGAKFETYARLCISRQVYNAIKQANNTKNQVLNSCLMFGGQGELDINSDNDDDDNALVVALDPDNPESVALKKERLQIFYDSVDKLLDDTEKKVLQMYLDGMSYSEMADAINRTTKNIDNMLTRIRYKLKQE